MKTPPFLVVILASVTTFALIPQPVQADPVTFNVSPDRFYISQITEITFDPHRNGTQYVEFVLIFNGMEVTRWAPHFNGTYRTSISIRDYFHGTGDYHGWYSLRAWHDNTTYWTQFEVQWSFAEIVDATNANTAILLKSDADMSNINKLSTWGVAAVFILWGVILLLYAQHKSAVKRGKRSIYETLVEVKRRFRGPHWGGFAKPRPEDAVLYNARNGFIKAIVEVTEGNPNFWDIQEAKKILAIRGVVWLEAMIKEKARHTPVRFKQNTRRWKRATFPEE